MSPVLTVVQSMYGVRVPVLSAPAKPLSVSVPTGVLAVGLGRLEAMFPAAATICWASGEIRKLRYAAATSGCLHAVVMWNGGDKAPVAADGWPSAGGVINQPTLSLILSVSVPFSHVPPSRSRLFPAANLAVASSADRPAHPFWT